MAVTTASILKQPRNGRFTSGGGFSFRSLQKQNGHLDAEVVKNIRWNF
jgi:hypothetical protein